MQAPAIERTFRISGATRWALIGVLLYVVGFIASMLGLSLVEQLVLSPLGIRPEAGTASWGVRLAAWHVVWGMLSVAVAAPIGRRLVPDVRFDRAAAVVLIVGLALAAITMFVLHEWTRARFQYFDSDYVGWAIFIPPAIVAAAAALWAALSLPREDRAPLVALVFAAAIAFTAAVAPSMDGLRDGLDPRSGTLAAVLLGDATYVVLGLLLARR